MRPKRGIYKLKRTIQAIAWEGAKESYAGRS
jgi:hypothetical protein